MSEHVRTTRETVELLLRTVLEGSRDDIADLYAEDVVMTNPFAPEGIDRESHGNAVIRARMKEFGKHLRYTAIKDVTIHETTDPQVAIAEFTTVGTIVATGATFEMPAINVVRVVDGLITETRDHTDAIRAAKLFEAITAAAS